MQSERNNMSMIEKLPSITHEFDNNRANQSMSHADRFL